MNAYLLFLKLIFPTLMLLAISCSSDFSDEDLTMIQSQIDEGYFTESKEFIQNELNSTQRISKKHRKALEFELERMRRIEREFRYSRDEIFEKVKGFIHDLTEEEFERYDEHNYLEKMWINGEFKYFYLAASNLFYINPEAKSRLTEPKRYFQDNAVLYRTHPHHSAVIEQAQKSGRRYIEPKRFSIRYSITVNENAVPDGEKLKVWIPFPREVEGRQLDITFKNSEPQKHKIAPNSALQRTIYLEKKAKKDEKTEFWVEYEYTSFAEYIGLSEAEVQPLVVTEELKPFLSEKSPHIVFTEALKTKSAELVGTETNPYKIARILFDYVDAIPWASAREYSTIRNLSKYAFTSNHSDCGQVSMLLMTLFRLNGIPTKWQSGWEFSDTTFHTMHDWFLAYFEPFGWVPVDVTHGKLESNDPNIAYFYLGGIDSYRAVFNDDYSSSFIPEKKHIRSETVDSQRGEVEWKGGNLYFDQWKYSMKWSVKDVPQAQ